MRPSAARARPRRAGGVWTEEQLVADVDDGAAAGRGSGAFFDFDGTVIDGYSLAAFARHHLRSLHVTPADLGELLLTGLRGVTTEEDFEKFTVAGMRAWAGRSEDELVELGERLFVQGIAGSLYPEAWRLVAAHLRAGHTVVLASSATRFQVEPAARALGVEHMLVSPVEIDDGICTGRPGGPLLWRAGKAAAVRAVRRGARHRPGPELRLLQRRRGRAVPAHRRPGPGAQPRPRPGRRRPALLLADRPVPARAAAVGRSSSPAPPPASAGCSAASPPGWRIGRAERLPAGGGRPRHHPGRGAGQRARRRAASTSQGAEHLATRPAVFLFNHQSQLDVLVLAKLLRGGFTGVAKKELANAPGFGLAFRLADVAFVDRGDPAKARQALEPAVEKLREGHLAGHRAGGHPVGHTDPRPVQEGRLPRRDAGRGADRADRHPQRRRADVARGGHDPVRHRAGAGAAAGRDRRLDGRGARRAGGRGPRGSTWTRSPTGRGRATRPVDGDRGRRRRRRRRSAGRAAGLGRLRRR